MDIAALREKNPTHWMKATAIRALTLDAVAAANSAHSAYAFLGVVRPVQDRPMTELSLLEAMQDQYITRHMTDGKIVFADHR